MLTAIVLPLVFYLAAGSLLILAQTPVDPSRYRRPILYQALMAAAGPAMNLIFMGVLIGILWIPGVTALRRAEHKRFTIVLFKRRAGI